MSLLTKVKTMFGIAHKPKLDQLHAEVKNAVQRNETASIRAKEALQEYAMTNTVRHVTGRMK